MSDTPASLLRNTPLLDTQHPAIERLVAERGWRVLPMRERIGAVYDFVRNEIAFGYNEADDLPASRVLADGLGQCNTKGTLLMALLRSVGVPCRFHGFSIDKALQKGAITGVAYVLAPQRILHSWVEVWFEGRWVCLEGFILDGVVVLFVQIGALCFENALHDKHLRSRHFRALRILRADWCASPQAPL
jgi:transglutaminase-like putative cysteine protease